MKSTTLFLILCILVGGLPLAVSSGLVNGIELTKLLVFFVLVGVLVSIRVWHAGSWR